jgi:hypothetical protein
LEIFAGANELGQHLNRDLGGSVGNVDNHRFGRWMRSPPRRVCNGPLH